MKRNLTKWEKEKSVPFESEGVTYVFVLSNMKVYKVRGEMKITKDITLKLEKTDLTLDDFGKEIRKYVQGKLFEDFS